MIERAPAPGRPLRITAVGRLPELDAVRGLAALSVVLGHLAITLPAEATASRADGLTPWNVALFSPLHLLFAGGAAVLVFFVLSGFVLTLSYEGGGQTYGGFVVRRIARIWIPYVVAVTAGMLLATAVGGDTVAGTSDWFNARWQESVDVAVALQHALLIGHFRDNAQYVPVIWSLVHEMRVSLVFPLMLAAITALGWWRSLAASAALTVVGLALARKATADFATLEYVVCFVSGALLARHRAPVLEALQRLGPCRRWALAALAVLLYTWEFWLPPAWAPGRLDAVVHSEGTHVLAETAAAAVFLGLAQLPGRGRDLLCRRLPQYLGRISYSLYLVHTIVLLTVLHLVDSRSAVPLLLPVVLVISIGVADLTQRSVERPAQRLGRRLAARLERRAGAQDEALPSSNSA